MIENVRLHAALTLLLLAAACGPTETASDGEPDLASELRLPRQVTLAPQDSRLGAHAVALRDDRENPVEFGVLAGDIEVQSDGGRLGLTGLEISLADVSIPAEILPPRGLELTDLHVRLETGASAEAEWTADDQRVEVALEVGLGASWAMVRDGAVHPLADLHVADVPVYLVIERDGGGLRASLSADRRGRFWSWAETFELRDLRAELSAL